MCVHSITVFRHEAHKPVKMSKINDFKLKELKKKTEIFLSGTKIDAKPTTVFSYQIQYYHKILRVCGYSMYRADRMQQRGIGPGAPLQPTERSMCSEKALKIICLLHPNEIDFLVTSTVLRDAHSFFRLNSHGVENFTFRWKISTFSPCRFFTKRCCWMSHWENKN